MAMPQRKSRSGFWRAVTSVVAFSAFLGVACRKHEPISRAPAQATNVPSTRTGQLRMYPPRLEAYSSNSTAIKSNAIPLLPAKTPSGTNSASGFSQRVFETQLSLVRHGISPGSIDGLLGPQTRAGVRAFQQKQNLPVTGSLDRETAQQLGSNSATLVTYTVSEDDLAHLQTIGKTWLAKSQQNRLDYETILELVAEKSQSHPNLIRRLNPGIDWEGVASGTSVYVPKAAFPNTSPKAAFVRIYLNQRTLEVFDEATNMVAHFPCSIAQRVEKRPVGELHVAVMAPNPNYTFDPEVFPESAEARELNRKLVLQPGPNNPVGTVWIGLDKPGYGIHGTPRPEDVGRTESHGCFRLANWNAEYLLRLLSVGTPVIVQ